MEEFRAQRADRSRTKRAHRGDRGHYSNEVMMQREQSHHNEHSLQHIEHEEDGDVEDHEAVDSMHSKWWTVKFPRRSSKVGLFGGNKGYKTQISLDHQAFAVVLQCDASNNNLVQRIPVNEIKNIEISEKKNVSIFTVNGPKYKIKCKTEQEATQWFNRLNQFRSQ